MTDRNLTDEDPGGTKGWPDGAPPRGDLVGGKYICEDLIGSGGMGAVLSGRHTQLGQQVAIKVLLPNALRDPLANERFLREARAAIVLRSEHIARVLDFGTLESGAPYLVMEYLDGCDLKDILGRKGPLPVQAAIDYVMQASEALCEAHRRGIVHRDLKPANMFLSTSVDGTPFVKVLDFGISKTVATAAASSGSGPGITRTDAVFGTPAYMSPEQLRSSKLVDHRTDIWSLGVTLYELLTGKLPFGSADDGVASMCVHILEDAPPVLHKMRSDIPEALDQVVRRCVEKDPANRWASIGELANALAPFGSASSAEAAARILRMSQDSLPFDSTVKSDAPPHYSGAQPATSSAWGGTGSRKKKKVMTLWVVGSAAGLFWLALGAGWWMGHRDTGEPGVAPDGIDASTLEAGEPPPSATAAASDPATSVLASSSISPVPAGSAPASAALKTARPRSPGPSAEPAAKPAPEPSAAPAEPTCAPGQVLSNGHCCVQGFEWKGGACVPGVAKGI